MRLALKVDVDTYDGMREGAPRLLRLFAELGIRASFFIPFGPDQSGRAIFRVFKKKGFLKKMLRTNALKLYGWKAALRGTLLPAPLIGGSFPAIARSLQEAGHELGIHGYNHVLWQDRLPGMQEEAVRREVESGAAAFARALGKKPKAFAAPAWLCSAPSLKVLDDFGFDYASDTRGRSPFYPVLGGTAYRTLQVPSTLPTLDEILAFDGMSAEGAHPFLDREIERSGLSTHVHSIHTEVEGAACFGSFARWIADMKKKGVGFAAVSEVAEEARARAPRCEVVLGTLPGRAGPVSCQK